MDNTTQVKIPGITFNMGGHDFVLASLNLRQVQELDSVIKDLSSANDVQTMAAAGLKLVTASLSRNYPDVTEEQVKELLDLGNLKSAINAVMGVSGFKQGEAQA